MQEGPHRLDEQFLAVVHGPFSIVNKGRSVNVGPDDVFLDAGAFSALGQMSNCRHLLRIVQAIDTDGGDCCVCLSERANLIGCPQCTATMCFGLCAWVRSASTMAGPVAVLCVDTQ